MVVAALAAGLGGCQKRSIGAAAFARPNRRDADPPLRRGGCGGTFSATGIIMATTGVSLTMLETSATGIHSCKTARSADDARETFAHSVR